ncbi:MAG: helix-turn-helix domain-containing protein [Actinobacteria bacterium]|jgi:excisionase family DNA binding protein|nr:helix-turn-helix domain-containing protein [Actinomycetota bacterium]
MENFYKVSDVAKIFKVKPITIRKWCQAGDLSARKFGKSWYIYKEDLSTLINSSRKPSSDNGFAKEG